MRHTSSHSKNRRSHHNLKPAAVSMCPKCGKDKLPHRVCENCGFYKGREIIDVLKKLNKKEKEKKEKEIKQNIK